MKTICLFVLILFSVGCGYSSNGKGTVAPGAPVISLALIAHLWVGRRSR
jgi:hypothetical protein